MSPYTQEYLAAYALAAARKDEWLAVKKALIHLERDHGPEGTEYALRGWIDTTLATMPPAPGAVRWAWRDADTGNVTTDTQQLPAPERWAAQMFGARQALDFDTWKALLKALPNDPAQIGTHVLAVLKAAALTLDRSEEDQT